MEGYYNTLTDDEGNIVNGATITVYDDDGGAAATLYKSDGVTSLINPFLSGYDRSEGEIEFKAADGVYNVKIVSGASTDWLYGLTLQDINQSTLLEMAAGSESNVSRKVMTTANGGTGVEDGANTWVKLCTITPTTSDNRKGVVSLDINGYGRENAYPSGSIALDVSWAQDTVGMDGTNSKIYIKGITGLPAVGYDNFKLTGSLTKGQPINLWMKKLAIYGKYSVTEGSNSNNDGVYPVYYDGAAWQSATPTGAVTVDSDGDHEGTWVPVLWDTSLSSSEGQTYAVQTGVYVVKGDLVYFEGRLDLTSYGTLTTTDQVFIGGLPFAAINDNNNRGAINFAYMDQVSIPAGSSPHAILQNNTNYFKMYLADLANGYSLMQISEFTNAGQIYFSGMYRRA